MQVLPKEASEVGQYVIDSSDQEVDSVAQKISRELEKETELDIGLNDKVNLIEGQNRGFYRRMREKYQEEMRSLETDITEWVTKVTLSVLKLYAQSQRQRV